MAPLVNRNLALETFVQYALSLEIDAPNGGARDMRDGRLQDGSALQSHVTLLSTYAQNFHITLL